MIGLVIGIASTTATAILGYVMKELMADNRRLREARKQENMKRETATNAGLTCLLRVYLIDYHERYTSEGHIPKYAFENWEKMFTAYRDLGGNGMAVEMDKDIKELGFKAKAEK